MAQYSGSQTGSEHGRSSLGGGDNIQGPPLLPWPHKHTAPFTLQGDPALWGSHPELWEVLTLILMSFWIWPLGIMSNISHTFSFSPPKFCQSILKLLLCTAPKITKITPAGWSKACRSLGWLDLCWLSQGRTWRRLSCGFWSCTEPGHEVPVWNPPAAQRAQSLGWHLHSCPG